MYNYSACAQSRHSNHPFGWLRFESRFFKLLNNDDDEKMYQKFCTKLIRCLGTYFSIKICQ